MKNVRFAGLLALAFAFCAVMALSGCASLQSALQGESYEPEALTPSVDAPTIIESGVLKVGIDADNTPFAGSANDETVGYNVDVAAALATKLGLKLELVDVGDAGAKQALDSGQVDIYIGANSSDSIDGLWMSAPYVESGVTLFAKPGVSTPPSAGSAPSVAAQVSSRSAWAVENVFGESSIVASTNLQSAFATLESGDADYVAADAVIGTYAAKASGVEAGAVALLEEPSGYCIAVPSAKTELQTVVSEALGSLDQGGLLDLIAGKWLGTPLDLSSLKVIASSASASRSAEAPLLSDSASTAGSNAVIQGQAGTSF